MTTPFSCGQPGRHGTVLAFVASLALVAGAARAQDNLSETLQRSEKDQQQIQSQAREFAAQLQAISSEFERNGLTGDSVKMLDVLSNALGTMSDQEMTRIIGLLRQARTLNDKTAVLQQVAAAYSGQKKLTVDMKALLARYQKDQATADVAATLAKLADRQSTNFQAGVDVAQWTETQRANKKDGENPQDALKAAVEVQSAEQAALRDEARLAMDRLENAARDKSDPAAARAQAALDKFRPVNALLDQAAQDLKDGHLFKAVGAEKKARDGLRQLARELTPIKQSDADALRQASREVDDMIAQQKDMIAQTEKANQKPPDFEKWLQQGLSDPKSDAHHRLESAKLADRSMDDLKSEKKAHDLYDAFVRSATVQANQQMGQLESRANDLINKSDEVGQNLQPNAGEAAATLKAAQDKLRAARANLDDHNAASAAQDQQAALTQLQQAQRQIQSKIAAEDAGANHDRAAALQAIRQQGENLAAQQNAASQQQALQPQAAGSNAQQQAELKKKAQDLQAKAAQSQSPAAAAAFQNAANQMEKAADALAKPNGQPQAQGAEAAAQAELAKANAALDRDIAQATAAKQQLQQAEAALAALEKVIAGEGKLQADATGLVPRSPAGDAKATKPPAAKLGEFASQQASLKGKTAAIIPMLDSPDLKPAAAPLNDAQLRMEAARGAFTRLELTGALESVRATMTDLLQAKALLSAKRDALQQQTDPQAAEQQAQQAQQNTTQQIAQAQQQAQQAQQQLAQQAQQAQQGQPPQAGQPQNGQPQGAQPAPSTPQALNDAANLAGQAAAASSPANASMTQSLQNAQQSLNSAAAAATQGDNATAQAQTQKAQDALAQAQAQAAQAQAGLAQAPPSGQNGSPSSPGSPGSPSTAPGTPGQKPGQQPGQKPGPAKGDSPQGADDRDASNIGDGKVVHGSSVPGKQSSTFSRLPARDRAALQQSQSEKYPQEYGAMIEQYMQNLADQPGS